MGAVELSFLSKAGPLAWTRPPPGLCEELSIRRRMQLIKLHKLHLISHFCKESVVVEGVRDVRLLRPFVIPAGAPDCRNSGRFPPLGTAVRAICHELGFKAQHQRRNPQTTKDLRRF